MCQTHYKRWKRSGSTDAPIREYEPIGPRFGSIGHIDPIPDTRPGHAGYLAVNIVNDIKQKALVSGYTGKRGRGEKRAKGWWALTGEQAYRLIVAPCVYCGIESNWPAGRNGIDRKDPTLGYTPDNCVTACWRCNRAKGDDSAIEFTAWVDRVHAHLHR